MNASSDASSEDVPDAEPSEPAPDQPPALSPQEIAPEVARRGRLLGIDFGTRRIGVAVTDICQEYCSPLHNYNCSSPQSDAQFFLKVVEEYEPVGLVFGLPLHMSGDESKKSREVRRYAAWLAKVVHLPVTFHDERHSSLQAEGMLLSADMTSKQRKSRMDKVAAQVILQNFVSARGTPD